MTASGGTGTPSPDTRAEHCTHASSLNEQAGPLPTSCHWRSRPAKPGQPLGSGRSPCAAATPRGRERGDASSQGSGARARRPPGNGRQGGRGPVPSGALDPSSPSGAQPVSQPAAPRVPPCRRSCGQSAGPGWACYRRPRPPRCWSRPAGAACRAETGAPWTAGPWGARQTWRARLGTRPQPPLPPTARRRGIPQRPDRGRARSKAQHQRGREPPPPPPPPAGCVCPRRAGLGRAAPLRDAPRAPARHPSLRRARSHLSPGARPAPPRRPASSRPRPRGARRSREGEGEGAGRAREGRGRGGGQLRPRPPSRRKCAPCPLRRSGECPSSSPGGRPLGVCAQILELMFNGNQRWKRTLEDPVPFQPRLLRRLGAATLGAWAGALGTRT